MKNIKTIILAACAVTIAFSSCKDDDDDTATQSVNVVSVTSTSFEATGGTDTITVDKPITDAYTNVSWATLTTDKSSNAVYVTAAANSSKESRHATVVVKASPVDSTIVNIDQFGTVFSTSLPESLVLSDDAQSKSYDISASGTTTISSSADWLTASITDGKINLSATANNTGAPRSATVTITSESGNYTCAVTQAEFDKEYAGDYYLLDGDSLAAGKMVGAEVELMDSLGSKVLYFSELKTVLPVKWDDATATLTIAGGTSMGTLAARTATYYLFADLLASDGYTYWDKSITYSAKLTYNTKVGSIMSAFADDGTISSDVQVNGLSIDAFKANEVSSDNYLGSLISFNNPILYKVPAGEGAKKLVRAKVRAKVRLKK